MRAPLKNVPAAGTKPKKGKGKSPSSIMRSRASPLLRKMIAVRCTGDVSAARRSPTWRSSPAKGCICAVAHWGATRATISPSTEPETKRRTAHRIHLRPSHRMRR